VISPKIASVADLQNAMTIVYGLFAHHCANGTQTRDLNNENAAACGQFVSSDTERVPQRGLHGTSAAVSVLAQPGSLVDAQTRDRGKVVLARLIRYLNDRSQHESHAGLPVNDRAIQRDQINVIKQAELLYALSRVPDSVAHVKALRTKIAITLKESLIRPGDDNSIAGWSYFTDDPASGPQVLPTAHAVLALAAANEEVAQPLEFLKRSLEDDNAEEEADISIRIFALYVLVFRKGAEHARAESDSQLRNMFDGLWDRTVRLLALESIEQNVEYWRESETLYVRVPWQLYMLALASRLRFYRRFSTTAAQFRLREITTALMEKRFRYPHSGKRTSSRTTSIALEVCMHLVGEIRRQEWIVKAFVFVDRFRTSRILRWGSGVGAALLALWSVYQWWFSPDSSFGNLAPEFIGPVLIGILLWSKGGSR